jgi:hypothetical protein
MPNFPFHKQPKLDRRRVMSLYDSFDYMTKQRGVIWLGPTGCGKTGLATAFLLQAIDRGYRGYFTRGNAVFVMMARKAPQHPALRLPCPESLEVCRALDFLLAGRLGSLRGTAPRIGRRPPASLRRGPGLPAMCAGFRLLRGVSASRVPRRLILRPIHTIAGPRQVSSPDRRPVVHFLHEFVAGGLRWLADGKTLLSAGASEICVWDPSTGELLRQFQSWGDAFSFDGMLVTSRGPSTVAVRAVATGDLLGTIVSLRAGQYAVLESTGHWRGSESAEKEFVYLVETESGDQLTLTPAEFADRFGWKNDPSKATLTPAE